MVNYINGFSIVIKSLAGAPPYQNICRIGNKEYRGMERAHLEDDLVADYYAKKLPPEISRIMASENKESSEWPFFNYIKDYADAVKVLELINSRNNRNELIAISSDEITKAKGSIEFDAAKIEWLGYDIMRIGGESMILNGLFFKPDRFARWIDVINEYGLFPMKETIQEYIEDYIEIAKDNSIEPYGSTDLGFDAIRVGRIL